MQRENFAFISFFFLGELDTEMTEMDSPDIMLL